MALLLLIILIEGFVSIALEILTLRQLLPVAGGSIIVTSIVIGIFLLFLALGYHKGGQQQIGLKRILCRNFLIAACFFGVGLSYSFIEIFFYVIQNRVGAHVVYPLITYLLLVMSPLIFLLGQTVPITMNMMKQSQPAGVIGGNALALSTLGSFLGAILTTLVLMHYLGVAWTIVLTGALLLSLCVLLTPKIGMAVAASGILFFMYYLNIHLDRPNFIFSNQYANYQVMELDDKKKSAEKILVINESPSSYLNQEKHGFPYIELIKKILFKDLKLHHADILVLGAGGFTLSAENSFDNNITYVDIDKQLKKAVQSHFMDKTPHKIKIDDARHFLTTTQKRYDAIVLDVYSDRRSIPMHLITKEYMQTILNRLRPEGVAIFNIIAHPFFKDTYSQRVDNTIHAVFPHCTVTPIRYSNAITNIIYACFAFKQNKDLTIYSDNKNTSTTDSFAW